MNDRTSWHFNFTKLRPLWNTYRLIFQPKIGFTQIVLKFKIALLFWTIHKNLMKISRHILAVIGHKICWSDKKQPVIVDLKPPKICTTFKQQATSVFTILNCRSGRTSCMWKFSVVATRLEQRLGCAYIFLYSFISLMGNHFKLFLNQTTTLPDWNFCRIFAMVVLKILLELSCCKKRQKSPNQETGLGNRGHLKVLNDTKLVLNEHELPP